VTADADRRRRFTIVGALFGLLGFFALGVVSLVAISTLRSSQEGKSPVTDERQVVSFPDTPNAVIGVVDDVDRLTSLAVLTLDPAGLGGSIAIVPVNVDQTNGSGDTRAPVSSRPYTPGDQDDATRLVSKLEPLLTLTIERGVIVGPDELGELLAPIAPLNVDLPQRIVDFDTTGSGVVAQAGERDLDLDSLVDAFTAISASGASYDTHDIDVELWSAVGDAGRVDDEQLVLDEFGRPVAPQSFDEFWDRLLAGNVSTRDIAISVAAAAGAENEAQADFVFVDRRDALLVFGAISPGLVSTPNESVSLKLVVGFDSDQIDVLGDRLGGLPITKVSMTRQFIGELLFGQANIVAVDLADTPLAIPERTILLVAEEGFVETTRAVSERFFGGADVRVADEIIDGVDVVVILGEDFLVQRDELLEINRANAVETDESAAEFDVSGGGAGDDSIDSTDDDADVDGDANESVGTNDPDEPSDTVGDDV
jgi:hypothetical protein